MIRRQLYRAVASVMRFKMEEMGRGNIREGDGEREGETEAEGVGVKALRDTTPVASIRLPKEPPFGNRASSSTRVNLSTVAPSRRSKLMTNEA